VEDIKELRKICQLPRKAYDTWYGLNVCRKISIYITRVILPFGVSADFVTLIFLAVGVLACFFFAIGTKLSFLIGIIVLQLWYVLDHVDGEVARYRKSSSITGVYFDKFAHYLVHPSVFFCLGWGAYKSMGIQYAVIVGYISGISNILISATEDLKESTILSKLIRDGNTVNFGKEEGKKPGEEKSIIKILFSSIHKICIFPQAMNIISLAVILNILGFKKIILWVLFVYAILMTLVWTTRLMQFVRTKRIDAELGGLLK